MEILVGYIATFVFTLVLSAFVAVLTDKYDKPKYIAQSIALSLVIYSVITMIQIGLGII